MPATSPYWFPAKRYGWGWGMPVTWQGGAVLVGYFCLLGVCAAWLLPAQHVLAFVTCSGVLSALLVLICYLKGEPPRWRWGDKA